MTEASCRQFTPKQAGFRLGSPSWKDIYSL